MSSVDWTEEVTQEESAPYANNHPLQAFIKQCSNARGVIDPKKFQEIANAAGLDNSDPKTLMDAGLIFRDADPRFHSRFYSTPQERSRDVDSVAAAPVAAAQKAKAAGGGATKPKAAGGGSKDHSPKHNGEDLSFQIRGALALLTVEANKHPNPKEALAILTKALALIEKR